MFKATQHSNCFFGCVEIYIPSRQPRLCPFLIAFMELNENIVYFVSIYMYLNYVINILYVMHLPWMVYLISGVQSI